MAPIPVRLDPRAGRASIPAPLPARAKEATLTGLLTRLWHGLEGHVYTTLPLVQHHLSPPKLPIGREVVVPVLEEPLNDGQPPIQLQGTLYGSGEGHVLVVVHGLGGDSLSHYMQDTAHRALKSPHFDGGVLCINLRGAGPAGDDIYHAGVSDDVAAFLLADELARATKLSVMGYSLGGHVCARYACVDSARTVRDPRVVSVAAMCPALDLAQNSLDIDAPERFPYRDYVLRALKQTLGNVLARRHMPVDIDAAMKADTVAAWDEAVVCPRHGFADRHAYYESMSVREHLNDAAVPLLIVMTRHDPMVLARTAEPVLARVTAPRVSVNWLERGGHVGFLPQSDLGQPGPRGAIDQALTWLASR